MIIYQLGKLPQEVYATVGGKASGLDLLAKNGFNVPAGFVITDIYKIDEEAVFQAFDALGAGKVSVRSSASNEDGAAASNAGQYETFLFVDREHLIESVEKCIDSLDAARVQDYAKHFQLGKGAMNIVVQTMIDSRKAGVLFTASPSKGSHILIEAVQGQGENLVSGQVSAHRYEISRKNYISCADDLLQEDEVKLLYNTGKKVRTVFGEDKDLEWAIGPEGTLYLLQMRPITTEIIDIEEFDRDEDFTGHLFTKRNVGEMMPGAVTPLTLSTSVKAIDYGMRYMIYKAGAYSSPEQVAPLHHISSISGHLFFDMNLMYAMNAQVALANPQSTNLSIMGEYHELPPMNEPEASTYKRVINSFKFLHFILSGHGAMKQFAKLLKVVRFPEAATTAVACYEGIDKNIPLLDKSLSYHYASSAYSGTASSTLYQMLESFFPDKNQYHSFLSHLLTNIPGIESADILAKLQDLANYIKKVQPEAVNYGPGELLSFIKGDAQANALYQTFLSRHGHRCIKEAEMRNKPWREDQQALMNYLSSILKAPRSLVATEGEMDYKKDFAFIDNPVLRKASITFAKRSRQAVVDRESTKSQLIQIIDMFKTQYARLAQLLVKEGLLPETDLIYFLTHEELGRLVHTRDTGFESLAIRRRKAYDIQGELSFDDTYMGKPVANSFDTHLADGQLKGVPVSNGECEGIVRIVNSADDANQLQKGEIMVARFTDIGWSPYYSIVNGLITEIGSSLSHGAVVAREYGLPAIVNVGGATRLLKNGDRIRMNAGKGTITVLKGF